MAEAEVETSAASKFFCHRCTAVISPKLPDYVCPRCNSGFIEILEGTQDSDSDSESSTDMDLEFLDVLSGNHSNAPQGNSDSTASPAGGGGGTGPTSSSWSGPRRSQRFRNTINPRHGRRSLPYRFGHDQRQHALSPILQEVIMQMTSSILSPGVGAELGLFPDGVELPGIPMILASNLASNPGDYAWGRGGLDAIITQLMNQLDGTGPPPLPQEKINLIPTVKISQDQCDKNLQCPVCMEDFDLDELVRKLNCEHCYHEDCIIPWLQLHGTCPVCRKALLGDMGGERENVHFHSFGLGESSSESMDRGDNRGPASNTSRSSNSFNSSNPRLNFMEEDLD